MTDDEILEAKRAALREARSIIPGYLATAEQWRYDRVVWAFNIMIGDIPEDSPEPPSPSDPDYAEWYPDSAAWLSKNTDWYDKDQSFARAMRKIREEEDASGSDI